MRKPRGAVARDKPRREPYDRVLIVCEGSKTELFYFTELARRYRLSTANIEILGEGADPRTLVNKAKELRQKECKRGDKFDKVYCVFDRDEHATFDDASLVAQHRKLELSRSWPCFEFWILLHFLYTRAPYVRSGDKSPAENCMTDLQVHLRGDQTIVFPLHFRPVRRVPARLSWRVARVLAPTIRTAPSQVQTSGTCEKTKKPMTVTNIRRMKSKGTMTETSAAP